MTLHHNQDPSRSVSHEAMQVLTELQDGFHIVRAHDCTPHILSREFRSAYGLGAEAEHRAILEALGHKGEILQGISDGVIKNSEIIDLLEKKPAFFELKPNRISEELQTATNLFDADASGMILNIAYTHHQFYGGKIESFPAIKKDNEMYRILMSPRLESDTQSDAERERSLSFVTLPTKVKTERGRRYAALQFVLQEGHPKSISETDLDDWMMRYSASGLDVGGDIGADDESLDNFIRYQGRLYWCDGDVIATKPLKPEEQQQKFEAMKQFLERFVR